MTGSNQGLPTVAKPAPSPAKAKGNIYFNDSNGLLWVHVMITLSLYVGQYADVTWLQPAKSSYARFVAHPYVGFIQLLFSISLMIAISVVPKGKNMFIVSFAVIVAGCAAYDWYWYAISTEFLLFLGAFSVIREFWKDKSI